MGRYLNQKGSAMVLVLAALMILMAVGSVIVAVSAANITMSRRYSNWSKEYYQLDYAAQDQLGTLDQNVLLKAEKLSRTYLQDEYYDVAPGGLPTEYDFLEQPLISPLAADPSAQSLIYGAWSDIDAIYETAVAAGDDPYEAQEVYNDSLKELVEQAFYVIYCACVDDNYVDSADSGSYSGIQAQVRLLSPGSWYRGAVAADNDPTLQDLYDGLGGAGNLPVVEIQAKESGKTPQEKPKQVTVNLTITPPSFSAVDQVRYYAVKANPLYANALSVGGTITFTGGNSEIEGDVVACNQGNTPREGQRSGVMANGGASAEIIGNVYTAGDIHLMGSGSSITVSRFGGGSGTSASTLKTGNYLYPTPGLNPSDTGNPYLLDLTGIGSTLSPGLADYTEGGSPSGAIPYIFEDRLGGNVYCNNLAVESSVTTGTLFVAGNAWTKDDIQNDAKGSASITLGGNYIGMHSDANEGNQDPNGSSAVINNAYMYGGSIALGTNPGSGYVIPGTVWYVFSGPNYYQTAESASAQAGEYFSIYVQDIPSAGVVTCGPYTDEQGNSFTLYDHLDGSATGADILRDRGNHFWDAVKDHPELKSNITVSNGSGSYALGVVNSDGGATYDSESNYDRYSAMSGSPMDDAFVRKTAYFGTKGYVMDQLYDRSIQKGDPSKGFYYASGSQTVTAGSGAGELSGGILFCAGDLTLDGAGTFAGSVICTGNLTISGGVDVQYSESTVRDVLGLTNGYALEESGSSLARRFFSPDTYSANSSFGIEQYTMVSSTAGERGANATRYLINSWREAREE